MEDTIVKSVPEGDVVVDGSTMNSGPLMFTYGADHSTSTTDVRNTQNTTITQTINEGQGLAAFFKSGGAETLIGAIVGIGAIGLVVWAYIRKKKKK